MKKSTKIVIAIVLLNASVTYAQNVGIGTNTPAASAKLDITSTNSGLLIPRVALTMTTASGPIAAPATSLMVYNTATVADVTPGYYFWDGTKWVRIASGTQPYWSLTGNAGTTAGTNFIGTTDAIDFVTRTNNTEKMRMTSAGNLGIGITAPGNKVDISAAARSGTHGSGKPLYVTGTLAAGSAGSVGIEFRHENGTQGIGFGYNTIYATGSNATQDLGLSSLSTGNLNFSTNAAQRMIILGSNGNVGMGLTNPAYGLELNGTFGYGNGTAGSYRSRTETRNDAGQIATQSGFFETSAPAPATSWPVGAGSWWHLLDVRHSNNANNYAMQIAGSFFDQNFWVRKTNNNASQAWQQLLTSSNGWMTTGNAGTVAGTNFIGTTDNVAFVVKTNNVEHLRITTSGAANIWSGTNYAIPNNFMAGGSLTIGNTVANFGGGSGWTANTAGLLLETLDNTEIAVHDAGTRIASLAYFESATNRIQIGRDMGWGAISTIGLYGNVGIGTITPGVRLDVNGTMRALDVFGAGGQNLIIGDDTYFSDVDVAHRLGLISTSNANIGELKLGNSATNPVLSGNPGYLYVDQEIRVQNNANLLRRGITPIQWSDQFDSGTAGVYIGNNESEEGGFWANGNYAMIINPGDNDLVKFVDEDWLDNAGSAYDNSAMRARIDGNGQYFQISDARLKVNIQPIQNSLEKLLAINGYTYQFTLHETEIAKGQKSESASGVLAQELEKVFPEAVSQYEGNYMVNYAAMTPLLIEAIQEQQTMINEQGKLIQEQQQLLLEMKKELEKMKSEK